MDTGKGNYLTRIEFSKGLGVFGVQVFIIFVNGSTDLFKNNRINAPKDLLGEIGAIYNGNRLLYL